MDHTLPNDPAEREAKPAPVVHYDLDRIDQLAACGYDLDVQGPDSWSANPALVTCPACAATLVDGQLPPAESMADLAPPIGPVPPPTEQRTVGLEVLTDELVAAENARRAEAAVDAGLPRQGVDWVPDAARVGIVLRLDGEPVLVPETDALWVAGFRQPPDVLEALLRQARFYADDHDGAELLMPTPDVLAALAGQPVGSYTGHVPVVYRNVQSGWLLSRVPDDDLVVDLVTGNRACDDETCENYRPDCVVVTVQGKAPEHQVAYMPVYARIPADQPVTR